MLLSQKKSFQPAEGKLIVVVPCGTKSNRKSKNNNFGCDETVVAPVLKVLVQALNLSVWGLNRAFMYSLKISPRDVWAATRTRPAIKQARHLGLLGQELSNFNFKTLL